MWTNKNNTSVDNKAASAEAVISTVKIIQPVTFYHATGRLVKLAGLKEFHDTCRIRLQNLITRSPSPLA
jgi:hypothetical protein